MSFFLQAQTFIPAQAQDSSAKYLAQIEVHTSKELYSLLSRAESLFDSGKFKAGVDTPVAFVLHGPEAESLLRVNYTDNKALVDLAARLTAFEVVDIKVCKTWMGGEGLDDSQLPPFIATVPLGPAEERRLMNEEDYVYF
jgi:intracellular sulfur oxidation DsrE/DsrF family protein